MFSCSSSEASDDEERHRSRLLVGSGRCARGLEGRRRSNDDEDPGDGIYGYFTEKLETLGGVIGDVSRYSSGTTQLPGPSSSSTAPSESKGEQGRWVFSLLNHYF